MLQADPKVGAVMGAATYGPGTLEPHHPDLFWYSVHAVETLYQLMGTGCVSVNRTHTEGTDVVVGTWGDGRVGVVRGVRSGKYSTYGQTVFGANDVISATSVTNVPPSTSSRWTLPLQIESPGFVGNGLACWPARIGCGSVDASIRPQDLQ